MSDIHIGDEVVCIYPGDGTGPDCKVGNKFIVLDIEQEQSRNKNNYSGKCLIFNCHPYWDDDGYRADGARAWRFAKVKDIEIFTSIHTKVKDKVNG